MSLVLLASSLTLRLVALAWSVVLLRRYRTWLLGLAVGALVIVAGLQLASLLLGWRGPAVSAAAGLGALSLDLVLLVLLAALSLMAAQMQRLTVARDEAQRHFELFSDHVSDVIWSMDHKGVFSYVSPSVEVMTGYHPAELMDPAALSRLLASTSFECARQRFDELASGKTDKVRFEVQLRTRSGGEIWGEVDAVAVREAGGRLASIQGVSRDITERRRVDTELRRSEARFRLLYTDALDAIFTLDADGCVVAANPACMRLTGFSPEELLQRRVGEVLLSESLSSAADAFRRLLDGDTVTHLEFGVQRKDGSPLYLSATLRPVFEAGCVMQIEGIARDVTEKRAAEVDRRGLEIQLLQAQKMEAVGTLAGGIAHDFNNLLTAILGGIEMALLELGPDSGAVRSLRQSQAASERAAELTRDLLTLSRRREPEMGAVRLNELVEDTASLLRRSLPETVEVATSLEAEVPTIRGEAGQLQQALLNLGINARDAMPEGGALTFSTRITELGPQDLEGLDKMEPGTYVVVSVEDEGMGMDRETMEKVFEPFFTTKERGKGTGLGLAMVYGCTQAHGGSVSVSSRQHEGTCFRLYLPLIPAEEEVVAERPSSLERGSESVLVVDDTDTVLLLAQGILERCGYRVLSARSGSKALSLFDRYAAEIDLVVTDLVMPKGSGRDLLRGLRQRGVSVPVVLTSGYGLDDAEAAAAEGFAGFVAKPFDAVTLSRVVRLVIDAARVPERQPG